ncbi:MAG: BatD family protein [Opitutaceae bacterium]|jgi:hypothetical protein|nr:BatD family protein [Opitutaceae bacterium]
MRTRIPLRLALLPVVFFLLAAAPAAVAQTVRWEPSSGTLARDQETRLDLVFENCEPDGQVTLPDVDGLVFSGSPDVSRQQSFNFSFGGGSRNRQNISSTTLTWTVRPSRRSEIRIPAFTVKTDRGDIAVRPATFSVGEATVGRTGVTLENLANARFTLPKEAVWAGEVFPLTYTLNLAQRFDPRLGASHPDWDSSPLVVEDWAQPQVTNQTIDDQTFAVATWSLRAVATQTGSVALNTASQPVFLATARNVFGMPDYTRYIISTQPATLTVKPLPQPAPANFTGAVGSFTLTSKVIPEKCAVGEPVTWTLELAGTGNWPSVTALPPREVSRDFRVVQPRAQKTPRENSLFDATLSEDVILIPTRPGSYTLGPVELSVFDPQAGTWKTLRTDPVTIEITGSAPQGGAAVPPASGAGTTAQPPSPDAKPPATPDSPLQTLNAPPVPPAAIPRDPLSPASPAFTPVSGRTLTISLLVAALWPLLLWAVFAWRRARATDPLRPRREARQRLAATLNALRTRTESRKTGKPEDRKPEAESPDTRPTDPPATALLLAWQHDAARLWNIPQAAPHARHFPDAEWAALWQETDRVLYRSEAHLSPEWHDAAERALATTRLPRFSFWRIFRRGNLAPFLPIIAIATAFHLLAARPDASAADVPTASEVARASLPVSVASPFRSGTGFQPVNVASPLRRGAGVPPAPVAPRDAGPETGDAAKDTATHDRLASPPPPPAHAPAAPAHAVPPAHAAYAAADFKTAETAWRSQLATTPADWSARYNLSLALAQQDRWPESAAQAIAAFVQHPCDEPVRWQLHLALAKAGYTPAELVPFTSDSPLASLAELLPSPHWQYTLVAGVLLLALALALALARGYRHLRRWSAIVGTNAFIGGALAIAAAALSLHVYGELGDTDAAVVWRATTLYSVPTEVDETQKTTPVAAGAIVVMGKDYLGWRRVHFPNGQTGWLRSENLTPLWR